MSGPFKSPPPSPPPPSAMPEPRKRLLEADVEDACCRYARRKGIWVRKFLSPNNRAEPDRLHIVPPLGWAFFIEYKRPGLAAKFPADAHEREQHRKHEKIRKAGNVVYVVDDIAAGKAIMDLYLELRDIVLKFVLTGVPNDTEQDRK